LDTGVCRIDPGPQRSVADIVLNALRDQPLRKRSTEGMHVVEAPGGILGEALPKNLP
jgi:hypothetical protein